MQNSSIEVGSRIQCFKIGKRFKKQHMLAWKLLILFFSTTKMKYESNSCSKSSATFFKFASGAMKYCSCLFSASKITINAVCRKHCWKLKSLKKLKIWKRQILHHWGLGNSVLLLILYSTQLLYSKIQLGFINLKVYRTELDENKCTRIVL